MPNEAVHRIGGKQRPPPGDLVVKHMKKIITIIFLFLFPLSAYSLSDREAFELLSQKSKEIKKFPFHVYIIYRYADFQGAPLPISSYGFFAPAYKDLMDTEQPDEIFATYQFSQGKRWRCFLLRVPGMYAVEAIDIWVFDTERSTWWQKPFRIAESWGDAGYSIDVQSWIEHVNKDSWLDIIVRTLERDIDLEIPEAPETIKKKDAIFIWDKDHFRDASPEYLPKMKLDQYLFKEHGYQDLGPGINN